MKVVYDANVLYPAPLRDFLMELALTRLFEAKWTEKIHDEWIRNVLKNRPDLSLEKLTKTKNLMNEKVENSLVTGFEYLIENLLLPDKDDCHILAAAIYSQANVIVTFNLSDFPNHILENYHIYAQSPDDFILNLLEMNSFLVCNASQNQRKRLKNPPKTVDEYLETLNTQGLIKTVAKLKELCVEI